MLIPTMTTPTPTLPELGAFGDDDVLLQMIRYTAPFDPVGNPTIALPAGFSAAGAPISIRCSLPLHSVSNQHITTWGELFMRYAILVQRTD
jgi:hypothetical protein